MKEDDLLDPIRRDPLDERLGKRAGGPHRNEQLTDQHGEVDVREIVQSRVVSRLAVFERRDRGQFLGGDVADLFGVEMPNEVIGGGNPRHAEVRRADE